MSTSQSETAFLFDVDNTLLDNDRVTIVFVRQGHYALDPLILARYPAADISLDSIGDLLQYDLTQLRKHADTK